MEWSLSQNKLLAFHRLMRTDKPIGALLLLWPTLWALWVATPGIPPLWILAVFVAGVWLMRAAGCVVNDYADRKFDGHVNVPPAVRCRAAMSPRKRRGRCLSCWCCFRSCWC
jgi:4-hydroxybenzoate polyprenyltransferase